ncbi:unknown protein (Partial), partial [Seminavis robusta]
KREITRAALKSKHIRHEQVVDGDGNVDAAADPESAYLKSLNDLNSMVCTILDGAGYNSKPLQIKLTSFSSKQGKKRSQAKDKREARCNCQAAQRQEKWAEVKDTVVPPVRRWTAEEDAELQRLKHKIDNLSVDDTLLGRQRLKMQTEALATVKGMTASERTQFLRSVEEEDDDNGDLVEIVAAGGNP